MKRLLALLFVFAAFFSNAATPTGYGKLKLNALTDMPLIGCTNFTGGLGLIDETNHFQQVMNAVSNDYAAPYTDSGLTVILPPGYYLCNAQVSAMGKVKFEGVPGKTFIYYNTSTTLAQTDPMFLYIGRSNIIWDGVYFTGTHNKLIGAFLQFNAYPNHCDSITIQNCGFVDAAVSNSINFGNTSSDTDWDFWNDHININHCAFRRLYLTGYQVQLSDWTGGQYIYKCRGINLQSTSLRTKIEYCDAEDLSDDFVFGFGCNTGMKTHRGAGKYYGNWEIAHNTATRCFMMVECQGNVQGQGSNIHDNDFQYAIRTAGFLISFTISKKVRISHNFLVNADRGLIECVSTGGIIDNNIGRIETWQDSTQGYMPNKMTTGNDRIHFVESYGFNNKIVGNSFEADRSNPNANTPAEYDGIAVITNNTSPQYGDTIWRGYTKPTNFTIDNNIIVGVTHRVVDCSNGVVNKLYFTNNTVVCDNNSNSPIGIAGSGWVVAHNVFDMTGSTPNGGINGGNGVIVKWPAYSGVVNATLSDNTIICAASGKTPVWQTNATLTGAATFKAQ